MKKNSIVWIGAAALALSLVVWSTAYGSELAGVKKPDQFVLGGKNLVLNGMGIREATLFNIQVYVGSLYLETKSSDEQSILDSPQVKRVELNFLRKVDAKKIRDAWSESYDKNCEPRCPELRASLDQLNSMMTDLNPGDSLTFTFTADGVSIELREKLLGKIANPQYGKVLLATWIGPSPPNKRLKEGMLSKK